MALCQYDEAFFDKEAEDMGLCENCKIYSCEKSSVVDKSSIKEKLISDLIKELGCGMGRPKRIRKIVDKYL